MKKQRLFLLVVILLTFFAGFSSGAIYLKNSHPDSVNIKSAPVSAAKPIEKAMPEVPKTKSKVFIGYVQDFRDPNLIDYSKLTHVVFSFVHPTKDGNILLSGDYAVKNLRTIVQKAKQHDTKVILAIGGWYHIKGGETYPYFKAAISNPSSRTKLANKLASFADKEHLDGIDIDFEHPRNAQDSKNLSAFTKQLSQLLHEKNKELSMAVYSKINAETLKESKFVHYDPGMFQFVDHVNIMAYDGQWDGKYNAANLSPYKFTERIVNYWSALFDQHHIAKEKLVLGVPFYAQPQNPKIKQVSYGTIIKKNPKNADSDSVKINGTTYYYNGSTTMEKKTDLALSHGFGGMMAWEAGLDAHGKNSLTAVIYSELQKSAPTYYSLKP
ncbi:glycoside hydrolase family 18 protein [Neobacillus mesonae]|uniref:glycoside hydrolase family 18 protein n=1 Tax=Neobacillus mesonae TaxID=1193713 RepID=UPI00203A4D0C|nr:glycoside hydrolase family 18 protein [Neobacillus mesonae]MCM3567683.1 glycoside hydrolase family 18 protein [Neobacillus mesonae]